MRSTSQVWLTRLTNRVGQRRSRLDYTDKDGPSSVEDQLLYEVLKQMLDTPFSLISRGVSSAELDRAVPGLRSKASRRFGDQQGLTMFALSEAIHPERSDLTDALIESAAQALLDPEVDFDSVLLQLGTAYFEAVCDDPCLTLQTFAWLAAREQRLLKGHFVNLYESLGKRLTEAVDFFLDAWGRVPIEGVTTADIATALTSLTEGLAMRVAVNADAVDGNMAAKACRGLLLGLTEPAA